MANSQLETFRKAGSKFGIDLKGFFDDDEEGSSAFGGLVPGLKTTSYLKGRSPTTATYKAPSQPARTTEFTLSAPTSIGLPGQQAVEKEAPEKVYYGTVGGVGVEDIGLQGFGLKDLQAARDAGYSEQSIKDYVESQRGNLYNIGEGAQKELGIQGYVNTNPGMFNYAASGGEGFGLKDLEALRARGVSDADARKLAANAPMIGEGAQKELGIQGYVNTNPGMFNYAASGGEGFGLKDLEALRARGVSDADARKLAANAPMIGGGAAAALNVAPSRSQQAEVTARNYDPGSQGGAGFGMADFNALAAQGVSEAQMREIAKRSPMMGPEARARLGL